MRGIKKSPRYLHDGRLLTLEDTVEFFNLVLELNLTTAEKADLVCVSAGVVAWSAQYQVKVSAQNSETKACSSGSQKNWRGGD